MFPGHFKIPGHSGTDFKHKKVFAALKKNNKQHVFSKGSPITGGGYIWRKQKPVYQFVHAVLVSIIIGAIGMFSYHLIMDNHLKESNQIIVIGPPIKPDKLDFYGETKYNFYTQMGNYQLSQGNLDLAHESFYKAIKTLQFGIDAKVGMLKVLQLKCQNQGIHCTEFIELEDYLTENLALKISK